MEEQKGFNLFDDAIEEEHRKREAMNKKETPSVRKNISITRITIHNFRNITDASWSLADRNVFTGPNHCGKTNSILAVCWLLDDSLLDGSSNFDSMKPSDDTTKMVDVEAEFNTGFRLRKTYREKWVKIKGTDDKRLSGNETTYYIDGVKTPATDAKREIYEALGVSSDSYGAKFDLLRALIDPYYLALKCPWRVLRSFIIDICGDVSPEEIMAENKELERIRDRLKRDSFDASITAKFYKQECGRIQTEIKSLEGQIAGLQTILPPSEFDITAAKDSIAQINDAIAKVKEGKELSFNNEIEKDLKEARLNLREAEARDADREREENKKVQDRIDKLSKERVNLIKKLSDLQRKTADDHNEEEDISSQIKELEMQLKSSNITIEAMRKKYDILSDQIDEPADEQKCPNCGFILNREAIEKRKKDLSAELQECERKGIDLAAEIDSKKFMIEDLKKKLEEASSKRKESEADYSSAYEKAKKKAMEIDQAKSEFVHLDPSAETVSARENVARLEESLATLKASITMAQRDSLHQISLLESQKKKHQDVLDKAAAYRAAQKNIEDITREKDKLNELLTDSEQKMALAVSFMEIRLRLFTSHISSVFGNDLKIQMIRENIKEGSWDEVCIPFIRGKNNPFADGSGSEQITTGIYMIECIKRHLDLPDLPIIFDESDKLDTKSIMNLDTKAQIITTKVDDLGHKTLSLAEMGGF